MIVFIACMPFLASCDVFVQKESVDALKAYEKKYYVLKKDIDIEGKKLKKGEEVRIVIICEASEMVDIGVFSS